MEMNRNIVSGATCGGMVVYVVTVQMGYQDGVQIVPYASRVRKRRR